MVSPIDIKSKKIIPAAIEGRFSKAQVLEVMERNIISHWDTWGKFQQLWTNQAYNTFKDFDKYLVLIYLISDYFQQYANKFNYHSYDDFYAFDFVTIDKLNLIRISTELNIPKETVRRKVNELQADGILKREGKSIILNRAFLGHQRPDKSLDALSIFLHKKSKYLRVEAWFGNEIEKEEIKIYIKKYFTVIWLLFLKLQIPYLLRHRDNFNDLETWMVWGNIALNNQQTFNKEASNSLELNRIDYKNYFKKISDLKIIRGVNASSVSDISGIPRATVIRKLRWLSKQNVIKKNKNVEYVLENKGRLNKKIEDNFKDNQIFVAEFLSDFFDYYKNSNFKP